MRPTHKTAADVHAMPDAVAGIGVVVVPVVASIRPSPAIPVMPPTRAAMDFVDEVGVFDGVTQAVGATERDGSGGLGEHAGDHDRCGCNDECESPHGVLLIERADRPSHRTLD